MLLSSRSIGAAARSTGYRIEASSDPPTDLLIGRSSGPSAVLLAVPARRTF
jgi:hypothetical protein